jgi:hypothetical protein
LKKKYTNKRAFTKSFLHQIYWWGGIDKKTLEKICKNREGRKGKE